MTKFRAWNVRRYMRDGEVVLLSNGNLLFLDCDEYVPMDDLDVQIELSTGLKDKNSVEIYEGDKIQYMWSSDPHYNEIATATVNIPDIYFLFETKDEFVKWDFEVIGNIHQHPELLKESESK